MGGRFTIFCFVLLCFRGKIYSEGRFNGGFLALRVLWGLYLERLIHGGLIFGILRYVFVVVVFFIYIGLLWDLKSP